MTLPFPGARFPGAALAAVCLLGWAGAAAARPPVWTIRDADSVIVLFGSMHMLPKGVDWLPPELTQALSQADDLWFELPLDGDAAADIQRMALENSRLPAGQTLSSLLSKGGRERLAWAAREAGAPLSVVDTLQPWYAETALGVAIYRKRGAVAEEGVERLISNAAPATASRRAFETGRQQIDMFAQGSQADQVKSLESSLRELKADKDFVPRLVRLWMDGDVRAIDKEVVGKMRQEDPDQYRRLIVERNRAWAPVIRQRLAGSGRTVMVVGVGHLVGRDGLPALLRAQGVTVEGP
jgi:uncharacterized protein YbaP (TraB family)